MVGSTPIPVYLDYNAVTPVLPEVLPAMLPFLRERFGEPSSADPFGQNTRAAVEEVRFRRSPLRRERICSRTERSHERALAHN